MSLVVDWRSTRLSFLPVYLVSQQVEDQTGLVHVRSSRVLDSVLVVTFQVSD